MWIETEDRKYINSVAIEQISIFSDGFVFRVKAYGITDAEYILAKYSDYDTARAFLNALIKRLNNG